MLKLVTVEAQAYLRLGLMSPSRKRVLQSPRGTAPAGVLFVPGVGANGSQFLGLKRALEPHAQWFDAFEYSSLRHPSAVAQDLAAYLEKVAPRSERLVVVGHSLGGLLLRMVLQEAQIPENLLGWVSICAPLHGTWRSKLALSPSLRALAPDSALMRDVLAGAERLARLEGRILTIGARYDQMISPHTSAFLDPHPSWSWSTWPTPAPSWIGGSTRRWPTRCAAGWRGRSEGGRGPPEGGGPRRDASG